MNHPWVYRCLPIPNPAPTPLPIPSLRVVPVHQLWVPCFTPLTWTGHLFHTWWYTCFKAIFQIFCCKCIERQLIPVCWFSCNYTEFISSKFVLFLIFLILWSLQGFLYLYAEYIIWNAGLDESQARIKISRRNIEPQIDRQYHSTVRKWRGTKQLL